MTAAAWVLSCVLTALAGGGLALWSSRGSSKKAHDEGYLEAMRDLPTTMAAMTEDEIATLGTKVAELRSE
jgi:hypothetical protein